MFSARETDKYSSRWSRLVGALTCVAILSGGAVALSMLLASPAHAAIVVPAIDFSDDSDYNNTPNTVTNPGAVQHLNQTSGVFRDVFWWQNRDSAVGVGSLDFINRGNSLVASTPPSSGHAIFGPGPYTALNFTGYSAGELSWLSVYDTSPSNVAPQSNFNASGGLIVSADVLFAVLTHTVSGGVVAMYNEGQDGLALLMHQGGGSNNDQARLDLVFQAAGATTSLLGSVILPGTTFDPAEWFKVTMNLLVTGDTWNVIGTIQSHMDPTNPNSDLVVLPIATVINNGSLSSPGNTLDLTNPGEVGVMAHTYASLSDRVLDPLNPTVDNVGISITNFEVRTPDGQVPEPLSVLVWALLIVSTGLVSVRSCRHSAAAA